MQTIQQRILDAVREGAETVPEIAALLEELTAPQISAHCSNLRLAGRLVHVGQVRYPGSSRLSWRYRLPDDSSRSEPRGCYTDEEQLPPTAEQPSGCTPSGILMRRQV